MAGKETAAGGAGAEAAPIATEGQVGVVRANRPGVLLPAGQRQMERTAAGVGAAVAGAAGAARSAEGGGGKICHDLQRRRPCQIMAEEEDGARLLPGGTDGKVGAAAVVRPRLPAALALVQGPLRRDRARQ